MRWMSNGVFFSVPTHLGGEPVLVFGNHPHPPSALGHTTTHKHACTRICMHTHMHAHTHRSIMHCGGGGGALFTNTCSKQVCQELTADSGVFIRDARSHLCSFSCVCAFKSVAAVCSQYLPHQFRSVLFQCCWY